MENKSKLEIAKEIIKEYCIDYDGGLLNKTTLDDKKNILYASDELLIAGNVYYEFIEVEGLKEEEYKELVEYYSEVGKEKRKEKIIDEKVNEFIKKCELPNQRDWNKDVTLKIDDKIYTVDIDSNDGSGFLNLTIVTPDNKERINYYYENFKDLNNKIKEELSKRMKEHSQDSIQKSLPTDKIPYRIHGKDIRQNGEYEEINKQVNLYMPEVQAEKRAEEIIEYARECATNNYATARLDLILKDKIISFEPFFEDEFLKGSFNNEFINLGKIHSAHLTINTQNETKKFLCADKEDVVTIFKNCFLNIDHTEFFEPDIKAYDLDINFESARLEPINYNLEKINDVFSEHNLAVILCPSASDAMDLAIEVAQNPDTMEITATVEAEYGNIEFDKSKFTEEMLKDGTAEKVLEMWNKSVLQGKNGRTYAHHGDSVNNPAPCNSLHAAGTGSKEIVDEIEAENKYKEHYIVVSHLDADTIGGIQNLTSYMLHTFPLKTADPEFAKAMEYIDVQGAHHIKELSQENQDKLNAIYAWTAEQRKNNPGRDIGITDKTEFVTQYLHVVNTLIAKDSPEKNQLIEKGKEWEKEVTQAVEDKLVFENKNIRMFETDGVFCNSSYYSPNQNDIAKAIISVNTKMNSITLSFEDGGKEFNAKEIVQSLWGPEAGGREGIAGSPRGTFGQEAENKTVFLRTEAMRLYLDVQDRYKGLEIDNNKDFKDHEDYDISDR